LLHHLQHHVRRSTDLGFISRRCKDRGGVWSQFTAGKDRVEWSYSKNDVLHVEDWEVEAKVNAKLPACNLQTLEPAWRATG
jgi:hypothetical protein